MNGLDGSWAADQVDDAALALLPQADQEPGRISVDNDMVRRALGPVLPEHVLREITRGPVPRREGWFERGPTHQDCVAPRLVLVKPRAPVSHPLFGAISRWIQDKLSVTLSLVQGGIHSLVLLVMGVPR